MEGVMGYPAEFKAEILRKMSGPYGRSARALSKESGVHYTTLSQWKRDADKIVSMSKRKIKNQMRPEEKTPQEKLDLLFKSKQLTEAELGGFLRSNGIRKADLDRWEQEVFSSLSNDRQGPAKAKEIRDLKKKIQVQDREIRTRDRELRRKDKALAEAAALLVLQKKVRAIWGDGDDDTPSRNER